MLIPVHSSDDILPAYRDTPVATLLRLQNLQDRSSPDSNVAKPGVAGPQILLSTCFESDPVWRLPTGFAIVLRTGAASLKRDPFKVSWAIGMAGVSAIAVIGHTDCRFTELTSSREAFVTRMIESAGWARAAAEQHFDHWSDLFAIDSPEAFVAAEAARLRNRYPKITVAPLLYRTASNSLEQVAVDSA